MPVHRISVRSFGGAPSRRGGGAPMWLYIGFGPKPCQQSKHVSRAEIQRCRCALATLILVSDIERLDRVPTGLTPHSRPHSSAVLSVRIGEVSRSGARRTASIGRSSREIEAPSLTAARRHRHRAVTRIRRPCRSASGSSAVCGIPRCDRELQGTAGLDQGKRRGANRSSCEAEPSISATSRRFRSMAGPAAWSTGAASRCNGSAARS